MLAELILISSHAIRLKPGKGALGGETSTWGRGPGKMTPGQLLCQQPERRLRQVGRSPGQGPAAGPAVWPERNQRLLARMKYLGAHIPRKWILTAE